MNEPSDGRRMTSLPVPSWGPYPIDSQKHALSALEQVSVTDTVKGSLVVLTDTETRKQDKSIWDAIEKVPGVRKLDLVYHNFEDLAGGAR